MKAWIGMDRNGDEGLAIVVFAETAGQAKAYTAMHENFCDYGFTNIRVNRCKGLDQFYKGKKEMDWHDEEDRVAMVRYAGFSCTYELSMDECRCLVPPPCPARLWCDRFLDWREER